MVSICRNSRRVWKTCYIFVLSVYIRKAFFCILYHLNNLEWKLNLCVKNSWNGNRLLLSPIIMCIPIEFMWPHRLFLSDTFLNESCSVWLTVIDQFKSGLFIEAKAIYYKII